MRKQKNTTMNETCQKLSDVFMTFATGATISVTADLAINHVPLMNSIDPLVPTASFAALALVGFFTDEVRQTYLAIPPAVTIYVTGTLTGQIFSRFL